MALKFLNKKGWHTGSLRNIENVWKAEQKHDAEQKKLEELRKQIQEEREKSEFRLLQEQAGLIPKQERLDFLYDSGLAVGKGTSDGFKALESYPKPEADAAPSSSNQQSSTPGALFEDKPQSANDAWRKLHSDPLLLIRQREQEALARIKNNPVQMANIRKSVQEKKQHNEKKKEHKKKRDKHSSLMGHSSEDDDAGEAKERKKTTYHHNSKKPSNGSSDSETEEKRKRSYDKYSSSKSRRSGKDTDGSNQVSRRSSQHYDDIRCDKYTPNSRDESETEERKRNHHKSKHESHSTQIRETPRENLDRPHQKQRRAVSKLSEEEKAARLREMQMDAVLHEEQRWKRLKKASENDAREGSQGSSLGGQNFLHAAQKSVYGAEKGGSSTIEESVRRRKYYSQGRTESNEGSGNTAITHERKHLVISSWTMWKVVIFIISLKRIQSFILPLVYAMMGSSRDLAVGTVAFASLLAASILRNEVNAKENLKLYLHLAFTATFFAEVLQAAFGFLRLGFIVDFLSHSTIVGFMAGAATVVIVQQLKGVLGLEHFTRGTLSHAFSLQPNASMEMGEQQ